MSPKIVSSTRAEFSSTKTNKAIGSAMSSSGSLGSKPGLVYTHRKSNSLSEFVDQHATSSVVGQSGKYPTTQRSARMNYNSGGKTRYSPFDHRRAENSSAAYDNYRQNYRKTQKHNYVQDQHKASHEGGRNYHQRPPSGRKPGQYRRNMQPNKPVYRPKGIENRDMNAPGFSFMV